MGIKAKDTPKGFISLAPIAAGAATAAIGIVTNQTVKALEDDRSRYTATFTGKYVGQFYSDNGC